MKKKHKVKHDEDEELKFLLKFLISRMNVIIKFMAMHNDKFLNELRKEVKENADVLKLCDGTNNLSSIAKITRRDKGNLSKVLNRLESKGIIYIYRQEGVEKYYRYVLPPDSPFITKGEKK